MAKNPRGGEIRPSTHSIYPIDVPEDDQRGGMQWIGRRTTRNSEKRIDKYRKREAVHINTEPPGPELIEVNEKENDLLINRTILASLMAVALASGARGRPGRGVAWAGRARPLV